MDLIKATSTISSDSPSPILIRRRLSAPETVMRKYVLARTTSQEMESTHQTETKTYTCKASGSDLNLNKKKDSSILMRKSTIFRRFLNSSKTSSVQDWHLSDGKMSTQSLTSLQGSPEHIIKSNSRRSLTGYEFRTSPHRQYDKSYISPKRKLPLNYKNFHCCGQCMNNKNVKKTSINDKTYTSSFSDYSDSAYSNSRSDMALVSNTVSSSPSNATVQVSNRIENLQSYALNESSTQTNKTTNFNVISNVQLSQSTLDLIVNQVMKDVHGNLNENEVSNKITNTINVQQMPQTYTDPKDENKNKVIKYMISNIEAGSTYKPMETSSVVTRFSALPSTTSMEVNTSGDASDDNSENSPFDSLEDRRCDPNELDKHKNHKPKKKSSNAFFIPLELSKGQLTNKVSDHLPEKVKLKLAERQKKLQERSYSPKEPLELNKNKIRSYSKSKHETIKNDDTYHTKNVKKTYKKDKIQIFLGQSQNKKRSSSFNNEYFYENSPTTKIYHKTEFENSNKKIEILEVMEYVQSDSRKDSTKKSKIPVYINQNIKNATKEKNIKPTYLDMDENVENDPKLDQLIANLLIQTLNDKFPNVDNPIKTTQDNPGGFEAIPEELNGESQLKNANNVNNNTPKLEPKNNNVDDLNNAIKRKAAVAVVKEDNNIPKGWITFYMLQNQEATENTTTNEGRIPDNCLNNSKEVNSLENIQNQENLSTSSSQSTFRDNLSQVNKNSEDNTNDKDEWSFTLSGSNKSVFLPSIEMRLYFPQNATKPQIKKHNCLNQNRVLPNIPNSKGNQGLSKTSNKSYSIQLPEIRNVRQRRENKREMSLDSLRPDLSEPRQTRTSTTRYQLSRPRIYSLTESTSDILTDKQCTEIMKTFPNSLSIHGNLVTPDKKSYISNETKNYPNS